MYFQLLRLKVWRSCLVFVALVCFVLVPIHPFGGDEGHWVEQISEENPREASELVNIYSVLKSEVTNLSDGWIWAISNTILEESRKHSLDPMLVLAVINVESSFENGAVSAMGARGLMQIRPIVAHALAQQLAAKDEMADGFLDDYASESAPDQLNLDDPILNVKLGIFYLHSLKKSFRDLKLALTAYNRGPTEVKNRLQEEDFLPLDYATKVLSAYESYRENRRQN